VTARYLYFAYGSNLHIDQMRWRCPTAIPRGPAILRGHRLTFRGVADLEVARRGVARGGLWSITAADLAALDRYEGYPSLYRRFVLEVEDQDGRARKAIVYLMVDRAEQMLPSRGYLETIVEGYLAFQLPLRDLRRALARVGRALKERGITTVVERGKRCVPAPPRRTGGMAMVARTPEGAPVKAGALVQVREDGIEPWVGEAVAVKFSPVSGWRVDVRDPDDGGVWSVPAELVQEVVLR
jgi:hypothetical protein